MEAFEPASLKLIEQRIELIPLNENDANAFGCNSVVHEKTIVMPHGCKEICQELTRLDFEVITIPLGEFKKAGGSAKCLTLWLEN